MLVEQVVSSLAASSFAEDVAHPVDAGAFAPRGVPPEEYRTDEVYDIISGAVEIERRFICEVLSCDIICMNNDTMVKYIEFVADRQLAVLPPLIFAALYHTNMYIWMGQALLLAFRVPVCVVLVGVFVEFLLPSTLAGTRE